MASGTVKLVAGSSMATLLGISAAALGANRVEKSMPLPPFGLKSPRFDSSTFMGRWAKMISNCDPATLLASQGEILKAAQILDDYEHNPSRVEGLSEEELWSARKLKESAIHPDTGEIVPLPFRMAGYVPFNGPICVAMMASTGTVPLLFWNWVNQTQNALVNYYNRNASSPTTNETLAKSYGAAVTAALTVAFGGSQLIKRTCSPARASILLRFVAFPASVVASTANCYIMRRPEIFAGVEVVDKERKVLAHGQRSNIAAAKAVKETVISRAVLQVPVFFVPALTMSLPPIVALCHAMPSLSIPLTTMITMIAFSYGLPGTVAIFPQYGSIETEKLEAELQKDIKADLVYYNKGL